MSTSAAVSFLCFIHYLSIRPAWMHQRFPSVLLHVMPLTLHALDIQRSGVAEFCIAQSHSGCISAFA